ncbi:MAG: hypothetical protein U1F68_21085 [Gammaproteobacteria bacterium]
MSHPTSAPSAATRRVLAEVPAALYRAAKVRAAEQGVTLRVVVTEALETHLRSENPSSWRGSRP